MPDTDQETTISVTNQVLFSFVGCSKSRIADPIQLEFNAVDHRNFDFPYTSLVYDVNLYKNTEVLMLRQEEGALAVE